ncbi:MAG: hypothetical protein ACRDMJ_14900 [Solirubrobacteraceae bacterium]
MATADRPEQEAHDVLAAEEFGMPAPDPALHADPPHDVLAADEFAVGARDPALNHGPVALPEDPTGIAEPHDVLAAEEFALPAGVQLRERGSRHRRRAALAASTFALVLTVLLRRRPR